MQITLCGPAGAGKGTIARRLATALGYDYVDAGLLFRASGYLLLHFPTTEPSIDFVTYSWDGMSVSVYIQDKDVTKDLKSLEVARHTALCAQNAHALSMMVSLVNSVISKKPDVICDGRNAGTVFCPEAELKLYVTAPLAIRAKRRYEELIGSDSTLTYELVHAEIKARDEMDALRIHSPLRVPSGAHILCTSNKTVEACVAEIMFLCR